MSLREPLDAGVIELTVRRLRAIAEPNRIALLEALSDGEATVAELGDYVGLPQQNTSHHLALLWREGILTRRSEGRTTLYGIDDWGAWWVIEQIAGSVQGGDSTK
jgi:DNA-binding transcriptional ArsR family regulator